MHSIKKIYSFLKLLQNKVKRNFSYLEINNINLRQSNFFVRSLTWGLIATSGLSVTWLAFAYTEEVVIVKGKLEPIGDVKTITIPMGGVVKEILVESGEKVSKDQILLVLDNEILKENVNSLENQITQKLMQLGLKKQEKIQSIDLFASKAKFLRNDLKGKLEIKDRFKELYEEGAISKIVYLEKINEVNSIESQIIENDINVKRQSLISSQEINQIESQVSELKAKKNEADVLLKYQTIKSPVDGLIFDLKPKNIGFVAESNSTIMKIVPFNNLEADVKIPSKKIGFVKIGMPVDISIDSFPANDFASLEGTIESIDLDVFESNESIIKDELFFPARIKLKSQTLLLPKGDKLPLQVGMSLKANIKLRKVSYLKLLLGRFEDKTESLKKI